MAFFAARFDGGFAQLKQGKVVVKSGGGAKAGRGGRRQDRPRSHVWITSSSWEDTKRRRSSFYREAAKYFRIHYPQADLIVDERTLDGVLAHIDRNIEASDRPLCTSCRTATRTERCRSVSTTGDTMRRSEESEEPPRRLASEPDGAEEALHPEGGGKSTLRDVSGKIDAKTTIHIRGCDLGQNKEFVNLIDEAFGGKGQVIASTHEQVYGTDPVLAEARARQGEKGRSRTPSRCRRRSSPDIKDKAAKKSGGLLARDKALKERQARINQKLKDQKEDIDEAAALAGSYRGHVGRRHAASRQHQVHRGGGHCRDRTPLSAPRQEATCRLHCARAERSESRNAETSRVSEETCRSTRPRP